MELLKVKLAVLESIKENIEMLNIEKQELEKKLNNVEKMLLEIKKEISELETKDDTYFDLSSCKDALDEVPYPVKFMLQVRGSGKYEDKAFYLRTDSPLIQEWKLKRDGDNILCLIPIKRK